MKNPELSIRIAVDPTNPGQFFACCGLLELADRLWPGAEGWFEEGEFCIACEGTLTELISRFAQAEITSSLSASQLKRLGTLLSVAESKMTPTDIDEKILLKEMWKRERLHISAPFDLWIDWWRDERGERTDLKTWAAKQLVAEMAQDMLRAIKDAAWSKIPLPEKLFQSVQAASLPFNFDSELCSQGSARDAGFSTDTLGLSTPFRPLLELAAFIGLQRFRPANDPGDKAMRFCLWSTSFPPSVAAAAASGELGLDRKQLYEFRLFDRTKYMKAFRPSQPYRGD